MPLLCRRRCGVLHQTRPIVTMCRHNMPGNAAIINNKQPYVGDVFDNATYYRAPMLFFICKCEQLIDQVAAAILPTMLHINAALAL